MMDYAAPPTTTIVHNGEIKVFNRPVNASRTVLSSDQRKVHFGMVVINEHPIIIGCNPAVSSGVPITIDWTRISQTVMSVHDYETMREPNRVTDFRILLRSSFDRYDTLLKLGYSNKELRDAEKEVAIIRKLRQLSCDDDDRKQGLRIMQSNNGIQFLNIFGNTKWMIPRRFSKIR